MDVNFPGSRFTEWGKGSVGIQDRIKAPTARPAHGASTIAGSNCSTSSQTPAGQHAGGQCAGPVITLGLEYTCTQYGLLL
jgi:hypothetical protein